jgi:methionyl-tRNA formyltransferase
MMIRVVFMGTPAFAVPTLQALLDAEDIEILGVLTQPDKPSGRGQKLTPPPVKVLAQEHGLTVLQPEKLRKDEAAMGWLREQAPDFFITVAYGQILSQAVLDIPKYGTVNCHASLLPEYRGPNPIQWAILDGKPDTGITTMLTEKGVDTGAMLKKVILPIEADDTTESLTQKLSQAGGPLLLATLREMVAGTLTPEPQAHDKATHAPKLEKEDGYLDWNTPTLTLHNRIRALQPWPGAYTQIGDLRLKVLRARPLVGNSEVLLKNTAPGEIASTMKGCEGLAVHTADGWLEILTVQPPGKREMAAQDWARGFFGNQPEIKRVFGPVAVESQPV